MLMGGNRDCQRSKTIKEKVGTLVKMVEFGPVKKCGLDISCEILVMCANTFEA
jgi:hypothetical protein